MTTLGLIGLGRIGAFHTETLTNLPESRRAGDHRRAYRRRRGTSRQNTAPRPSTRWRNCCPPGWTGSSCRQPRRPTRRSRWPRSSGACPTFCEKPVASTAAESARVAPMIARSGVPVQSATAPVRRGVRRRQARRRSGRAPCTPCAAPRWIPLPRRWTTSRAPAAPSGTARCTTSTSCAGSPARTPSRCTRPTASKAAAVRRVRRRRHRLRRGDGSTAEQWAWCPAARYNARGYDCRLEVHGFEDSVVAGWDQGVPVRNWILPTIFPQAPTPLLHGPVHRGVPYRTGRVRRGWSRATPSWARRWPTRSRSPGSPRPPQSPCAGASR